MTSESLNYQRIQKAIEFLVQNVHRQPSLEDVSSEVHLSPFHFQRIFTEWAGVSPKRFLQFLTLDHLKKSIHTARNINEMASMAGLSSQSRVYDLFVSIEGITPGEYKKGGIKLVIHYGYHTTPFGLVFIAATTRGICGLSFADEHEPMTELDKFKKKWPFASFHHSPLETSPLVEEIFSSNREKIDRLTLCVQGTNFQIKVWEALLSIPSGQVTTYEKIAEAIGNDKAVRAVGTAVGKNPIAYLIPCHRVIRKEGKIGQYHWGRGRKHAIIGWEMAQESKRHS